MLPPAFTFDLVLEGDEGVADLTLLTLAFLPQHPPLSAIFVNILRTAVALAGRKQATINLTTLEAKAANWELFLLFLGGPEEILGGNGFMHFDKMNML